MVVDVHSKLTLASFGIIWLMRQQDIVTFGLCVGGMDICPVSFHKDVMYHSTLFDEYVCLYYNPTEFDNLSFKVKA